MSTSAQYPDPHPPNDRSVVAIAWAVGAVAVAAAVAFIAWLALGQGGDDGGAQSSTETSTQSPSLPDDPDPGSQPGAGDEGQAEQGGDTGPGDAPAAQTPSAEIAELLLALQRRDESDTMAIGDVDAPVVMIEFADYRCPFCARFHLETRPDLMPLVEDGTLRIEFRDLVVFDETSELAAVAGRAAAEQGQLTEFQKEVFALSSEGQAQYDEADLIEIAEEVGVPDIEEFTADLESEELLAAVRADTAEGQGLGVQSTPTFLINTQVVEGAYPASYYLDIIEAEREAVEQGE